MRRLSRIRPTSFGPAAYVAEVLFDADGRTTDDREAATHVARSWHDVERRHLGEEYGRLAALEPVQLADELDEVEVADEELEVEPPTGGATWSGVVVLEGTPTGDGRYLEPDSLRWQTPLPLRYVEEDTGGHQGARVVGIVDQLERRDGGEIFARGRIDLGSDHGREVARQLSEGLAGGVSADLDDVTVSVRVAAELLEAGLIDPEEPAPELEVDDDGRVEVARMAPDDEVLVTEDGRIRAVTLVDVPAFVEARIALDDDQELEAEDESIVAAAGLQERQHVAPLAPPAAWFQDPQLAGPTALTVTDDGRVYGHVAQLDAGACHSSHGTDRCVRAPRSSSDYAYFRTGAIVTEEGDEVAVGRLTMDGPHASLRANADETARHYDDSTRVAAYVAAGEDAHGIWIAGSLRADLDPEDVVRLRGLGVSGDWRQVTRGGGLEMLAVLAVPVQGFPIPRAHVTASAGAVALVASSGALARVPDVTSDELGPAELRVLRRLATREVALEAERLRSVVHGTPQEHAAKLAASVGLEA